MNRILFYHWERSKQSQFSHVYDSENRPVADESMKTCSKWMETKQCTVVNGGLLLISMMIPVLFISILLSFPTKSILSTEDGRAREWLANVNRDIVELSAKLTSAKWNYETNINADTAGALSDADTAYQAYQRSLVSTLMKFDQAAIEDSQVYREIEQMRRYAVNETMWTDGNAGRERFLINTMTEIFNTNSICSMRDGRMSCSRKWIFNPDILSIFANSRDYDQLTYVWTAWRDTIGPTIRPYFIENVGLSNVKARAINFSNLGDVWRSFYETTDFEGVVERLFYEILPLYEQLHTYVRRRLKRDVYPNRFSGMTIPVHILGNVMGEEWSNIYSSTVPYPNHDSMDVTDKLRQLGYDQKKLYTLADEFYISMGLLPAPVSFWDRSIFIRIANRPMVCQATSWDMFREGDVRVRVCARVSQYDFHVAHHEMGHIQYFLQYSNQPISFRQPANPGFHESIGDTIALAAGTRQHLIRLGLLDPIGSPDDPYNEINTLYRQALFKLPFLSFSYLVDVWRWRVFDATYTSDNLNKAWWDLNYQLMGLVPPVPRDETNFDPSAKSHIVDGVEFSRYFIAGILQFQFYRAMCGAAGHRGPLHQCDFYNNTQAGNRLAAMLKLGSSQHWTEALREMTGEENISAKAVMEYFGPLNDWLKGENEKMGECYGWGYRWPDHLINTLPQPRC